MFKFQSISSFSPLTFFFMKTKKRLFIFHCFSSLLLDSITKRIKQLEDLITDNNAANLLKHVALLTTKIATSSALTAATTSITNQLEASLNTSVHSGKIVSVETLLDALVILFEECSNSTLRREKTVSDFLELRKLPSANLCSVLLTFQIFSSFSKNCSQLDQAAATRSQRLWSDQGHWTRRFRRGDRKSVV